MKKLIALLLAVVMVVGLFVACDSTDPVETTPNQGGNETTPNQGGNETKPSESTPDAQTESETPLVIQWDEANGSHQFGQPYIDNSLSYHSVFMWEPLYRTDASKPVDSETLSHIVWCLATGYEWTDDNLSVTITLRDDLKFSDGQPITVEDLIWTAHCYVLDPTSKSAASLKNVVGYEAVVNGEADTISGITAEGNKVTFKLVDPVAQWMPNFFILPKHCFEGIAWADIVNAPYWKAPVTTGPYKFVDAQYPDYAKLTRNEYYWGEPAGIKNVTCLSFEAATTDAAIASMISGDSHITTRTVTTSGVIANQIKAGNPAVEINSMYSNNIRALVFNFGKRTDGKCIDLLVNDANVRKAISLLVDEVTIGEYVAGNPCILASNPDNQYTSHDYDADHVSLDTAKAKELLDAAGWDYNTVIEICCYYTDQVSLDVLEIIKADGASIGVQFEIDVVTENAGDYLYTTRNYDIMFYQGGGGDLSPFIGSGVLKSTSAWTFMHPCDWINEKYDPMIIELEGLVAGTPEYTEQMNKIAKANYDDTIIIPIYVNSTVMCYNSDVIYVPETAFDYYDNVLDLHLWKMLK